MCHKWNLLSNLILFAANGGVLAKKSLKSAKYWVIIYDIYLKGPSTFTHVHAETPFSFLFTPLPPYKLPQNSQRPYPTYEQHRTYTQLDPRPSTQPRLYHNWRISTHGHIFYFWTHILLLAIFAPVSLAAIWESVIKHQVKQEKKQTSWKTRKYNPLNLKKHEHAQIP